MTIQDEKIIRYVGHHIVTEHEVDKTKKGWEKLVHIPYSETDLQVLEFTTKCKLRATTEDTPANIIYNEELRILSSVSTASNKDLANCVKMKSFQRIKSTLQRRRTKRRARLPKSLKDVFLTEEQKRTTKGEKFIVFASPNNKILTFCSAIGLEILSKSRNWGADGTFYTAAKYYYQLYIISAYYLKRMIPCVWSLMHRRRVVEYNKVLKGLVKEAKKNKIKLKPATVMMDFEKAAMNAFLENFPGVLIKLCLFHFSQSLFKHIVSLGFKDIYTKDAVIKEWFKKVFALALVPLDDVDTLWAHIIITQPELPNTTKFLDYVVHTYFEGDFAIKSWNHFETDGPRTNNNMEGYNSKLKKHVGTAHPNIHKAIEIFQQEEVLSCFKYFQADKGEKPPPRHKLVVFKDELLPAYKKMYLDKDISFDTYLKYILPLYDLSLKKKINKVTVGSSEESSDSENQHDTGSDSDQSQTEVDRESESDQSSDEH